jgi:hypothetical protein
MVGGTAVERFDASLSYVVQDSKRNREWSCRIDSVAPATLRFQRSRAASQTRCLKLTSIARLHTNPRLLDAPGTNRSLATRETADSATRAALPDGLEQEQQYCLSDDSFARAAQGAALGLDFGPIDHGMTTVIEAWPTLPQAIRAKIFAIVREATQVHPAPKQGKP